MKKFLIIILSILIIAQALSLFSCSKKQEKFTYSSFEYFDTVTTIVGYSDSRKDFDSVCSEISSLLGEYHKLYDIYNAYEGINNLYSLNRSDSPIQVDKKIIDLILYSKDIYNKTNGKLNIAMGSVLSIWHDCRERALRDPSSAEVPDISLLEHASYHTNIEDIIVDAENSTVYRADRELLVDVGAIAKGYAVEMAAKMLEDKNIKGYLINVGGNVRAVGAKADGEPWSVGVENPDSSSDDAYAAYLDITDEALVTSGSYQRYYEFDGIRYHHIIDPETLMPSAYYLSVSVLCDDSALADALSTSLFSMPLDDGKLIIESTEGVEAMWILPSGEKTYSSGFNAK